MIILIIMATVICCLFLWSACVVSGRCSRIEEDEEFEHIMKKQDEGKCYMDRYIKVPLHLLTVGILSPRQIILLGLLYSLAQVNGYCYATNYHLSKMLNVNVRTITSCLKVLKEKGFIKIKVENNNRKIFVIEENMFIDTN